MTHGRDAEDAKLLQAGDIAGLLAAYNDTIVGRCVARLRGSLDAEDVAQNVRLRLLSEFHRGRSYGDLPYRVVVHQVIGWTLGDYHAGRPTDVPLPEGWEPASPDASDQVAANYDLRRLFETLPEKTRAVLELRYSLGLEHEQIAERLGMKRNAVDQALNRGHSKLRDVLVADG